MSSRTAAFEQRTSPYSIDATLLTLASGLLLLAMALAFSASSVLPITLALFGAAAAFGILQQAVTQAPRAQANTVTV